MEKNNTSENCQLVEVYRRRLPPELLNGIYATLTLEKAFELLARMPNCLLARNIRQMLNQIKKAIKNNRWNLLDCSPRLIICDDALMVINNSQYTRSEHSVRSEMPIRLFNFGPKRYVASYFEVKIFKKEYGIYGTGIGFCNQEFPLTGEGLDHSFLSQDYRIGRWQNSIGIYSQSGIYIDGSHINYQRAYSGEVGSFAVGSVVGCGLIHSGGLNGKLEYFGTYNGKLMGLIELPA